MYLYLSLSSLPSILPFSFYISITLYCLPFYLLTPFLFTTFIFIYKTSLLITFLFFYLLTSTLLPSSLFCNLLIYLPHSFLYLSTPSLFYCLPLFISPLSIYYLHFSIYNPLYLASPSPFINLSFILYLTIPPFIAFSLFIAPVYLLSPFQSPSLPLSMYGPCNYQDPVYLLPVLSLCLILHRMSDCWQRTLHSSRD